MSDKPKHTPGPWTWNKEHAQVWAKSTGEGPYAAGIDIAVAIVRSWDGEPPPEQANANARLIAASPDLKDSLAEIYGSDALHAWVNESGIDGDEYGRRRQMMERARLALVKATGVK